MSYNIKVNEHPDYLHFYVTGEDTIDNVQKYLDDVIDYIAKSNTSIILLEEHLTGKGLSIGEIFWVVSDQAEKALLKIRKIAYVDINSEHLLENQKFAETVARNRGINMKAFANVEEAKLWLLGEQKSDVVANK